MNDNSQNQPTTPPADMPQPTPEQIEAMKLAVISDVAHAVGNPEEAFRAAGDKLNHIYAAMHEAGQDTQIVHDIWSQINALAVQGGKAADFAAQARALAEELKTKWFDERTAHIQSKYHHENLERALYELDENHPQVATAIDHMREDVVQDYAESGAFISYCPACEIIEHGGLPVTHDVAQEFHMFLFNSEELTADELDELAEFMTDFVARFRAREESERAS